MQFPTMPTDGIRRPVVPLTLETIDGATRIIVDALIDTGSDITLFSADVATLLGINLGSDGNKPVTSALGTGDSYWPAELFLELRRFPELLRWKATVGFLPRQMAYGLLGTKGFFEFFRLRYDARQNILDIEPGGPLPL